jgi:uncharacterized membrane protein
MSADAVVASRTAARDQPRWEVVLLGLTVLSLGLIPVHIHRAFGLPAHPLLLHVPVVLVPVAGIAALALVARPAWMERYGVALGVLAVAATAATILTVGAGEAFRADRAQGGGGPEADRLAEHAQAGENLRLVMIAFTVALLVTLLLRRLERGGPAVAILRAVVAVLAVLAVFFVIRTGHLGAQLTWERDGGGGPPGGGRQFRPPGDDG